MRLLLLAGLLARSGPARAADGAVEAGARDLEQRLFAPCCYTQVLAAHESGPARALRQEIRERLTKGEPAARIHADLVHRYGSKVMAVPMGVSFDVIGGLCLGGAGGLASLGLALVIRRFRRRIPSRAPASTDDLKDPEGDARLDQELAALD